MDPTQWIPTEAAYHLSEAYADSLGQDGADPSFATLHALALTMDANPEYLEEVWDAWCEEMERDGWTAKQVDDARYWLDVVILEELSTDDTPAAGANDR